MTAQAGICAEPNLHASYLLFDILPGQELEVRTALARFPALCDELDRAFPEAGFSGLIAIGEAAWERLYPHRPPLLQPFPAQACGDRQAPATPYDLFVQLRADRLDLLHLAGQRLLAAGLGGRLVLREEVQGFRYLDCRDVTGFVDGTENPKGAHRAEVALVAEGEFADGSYLHIQRFVHDMTAWERLNQKAQEDVIGRSKVDNIEYEEEDKPPTAHIRRTNLEDADGNTKEILRQSMPWGTLLEQGLFFISCCATPAHFSDMLASMYRGEGGHFDHLLRFTRAVSGAAFFAPSVEYLQTSGRAGPGRIHPRPHLAF